MLTDTEENGAEGTGEGQKEVTEKTTKDVSDGNDQHCSC